jgi:hypothetical protein
MVVWVLDQAKGNVRLHYVVGDARVSSSRPVDELLGGSLLTRMRRDKRSHLAEGLNLLVVLNERLLIIKNKGNG